MDSVDSACACAVNQSQQNSQLCMSLEVEAINHPTFGKSDGLKACINLLYPKGSYVIPDFFDLSDKDQADLIDKAARRLNYLLEDLDDEEMNEKASFWLISTACCFPKISIKNPIFEFCLNILGALFAMDDILDDAMDGMQEELRGSAQIVYKVEVLWNRILSGSYESFREVGNWMALVTNPINLIVSSFEGIEVLIPGCRPTISQFFQTMYNHPISFISSNGDELSEEGLRVIRSFDGGFDLIGDLGVVLENSVLSKEVRECLIFRLFTDTFRIATALTNDIFGILKDIKNSDSEANLILRRIGQRGLSLDESFEMEYKKLRELSHDLDFLICQLILAFPNESNLQAYLDAYRNVYDGQLYGYYYLSQRKLRYGNNTIKIIQNLKN